MDFDFDIAEREWFERFLCITIQRSDVARVWLGVYESTPWSKRLRDAIQRRVAIDQINALPGDADGAVELHQPVPRSAGEQPLRLAPIFDHQEFRADGGG